jgi:diaminopimelate decarboxylase
MANAHPLFLSVVKEEGLNLFVNSLMHLRLAIALGFSGERIIFAGSALDEQTMREAQHCGAVVNLDSLGQVARWKRLFPEEPFGIRCNIGDLVEPRNTRGGYFIGKESRLGLTPQEMQELTGDPRVAGLHLYVGTDICAMDYFRQCYEALAGFAGLYPNLAFLDFGGGFGLEDESGNAFDFGQYGRMAADLMKTVNARLERAVRMIVEPGRIIGARAGWFVCRVVDVKRRGKRQLVGVNASSVQFPRPLLYPESARHPVWLLRARQSTNGVPWVESDVYGCSTYSRDFLARAVSLPPATEGDIVVLGDAGSYCAAMFTHFLGFPQPKEIFYDPEDNPEQKRAHPLLCDTAQGV